MSKKQAPVVVLVGRTNVGKSTLFNRIAKKTQSIVHNQEGITRDFLHEVISWNNKRFDLVDTGGLSTVGSDDPFQDYIQEVGISNCKRSSVVLFVCDGKIGLTEEDRRLARMIHKLNKETILVLNKCDNKNAFEENEHEFLALGFTKTFAVSAVHNVGINELLNEVTKHLTNTPDLPEQPSCKISLIGKPNVGKSSLMNALLKTKRSIISDMAGTTREAISERISFYGEDLLVTDTAGIRRKRKVNESVETSMVKSALAAVRTSDIVLLVVDGNAGRLSDQELKLMFYAFEHGKGLIIIYNKSDLLTPEKKNLLTYELKEYEFFLKKIPHLYTSCITEKNIGLVSREIEKLRKRMIQKFDTVEVTELIHASMAKRPLWHKRQAMKVYSIKQVSQTRVPTFTLHVNYPDWFEQSQLAYIENILRRNYDLRGCPVLFVVKKRDRRHTNDLL